MQRVAIVVRLNPGARERAGDLLDKGPPFDLAAAGFDRHAVYLSDTEVVFVFEGQDAEWKLDDLTSDVFHEALHEAFGEWRTLADGKPHVASELFFWERGPQ